jgi:hypothetical protein
LAIRPFPDDVAADTSPSMNTAMISDAEYTVLPKTL